MKFSNTCVFNIDGAVRGARNPMESWERSDSYVSDGGVFCIGDADMTLLKKLITAGESHRKFLRQIFVCVDITAPLYWFKEFSTYKIGTVANSTSTMHKIMSKPFDISMFETDDFDYDIEHTGFKQVIERCNEYRKLYLENKDSNSELAKKYWKALIRILPEGWLQTRTITMNYENVRTMVHQRKGHKLTEWHQFIDWAQTLPYAKELIFFDGEEK